MHLDYRQEVAHKPCIIMSNLSCWVAIRRWAKKEQRRQLSNACQKEPSAIERLKTVIRTTRRPGIFRSEVMKWGWPKILKFNHRWRYDTILFEANAKSYNFQLKYGK